MRKEAFVADQRGRKAGALSSDGSGDPLKALRKGTRLSTAPADRAAALGGVMSTRGIRVGGLLFLLTAVFVWPHDKQPKGYWQLRREALEGLDRSRDQNATCRIVPTGSPTTNMWTRSCVVGM